MTLFLLLSFAAFFSISSIIDSNKSNAHLVNVSGRQRMLSQRIAKYAILYDSSNSQSDKNRQLKLLTESINLMETSHRALSLGSAEMDLPQEKSPEVSSIYFEEPIKLDNQVKEFISRAKKISSTSYQSRDLDYIIKASRGELLESLNSMVHQYEKEGNDVTEQLFLMEKIVLALTLLTIIFEIFVIFLPMEAKIKDYQKEKERHIETLEIYSEDLANTAYACSHSLKEPTRALLVYLSMLKSKMSGNTQEHDDENFEFLEIIEDEANRIIQLITCLRDYLIITDDDSDLSEISMNDLIDNIIIDLKLNHESIKMADLPKLYSKEPLVKKVFYEILKNAKDFSHENGVDLQINYKKQKRKHCFSIKDHGIGIEEKFLATVLQPFSKLDANSGYDKHGMGLSIAKRITNFLGGNIFIESSFGKYTQVNIELPA